MSNNALALVSEPRSIPDSQMALVLKGDVSKLTPSELVIYYANRCAAQGLDPATKPFDIIPGPGGTQKMYPNAQGAQQVAANRAISTEIASRDFIPGEKQGERYIQMICRAIAPSGQRTDAIALVSIGGLAGEAFCNAMMKCETKAKRRAILALTGLGMDSGIDDEVDAEFRPQLQQTGETEQTTATEQAAAQSKPLTAKEALSAFNARADGFGAPADRPSRARIATMLLGYVPEKWTADVWTEAAQRTETEWLEVLARIEEEAEKPEPAGEADPFKEPILPGAFAN